MKVGKCEFVRVYTCFVFSFALSPSCEFNYALEKVVLQRLFSFSLPLPPSNLRDDKEKEQLLPPVTFTRL